MEKQQSTSVSVSQLLDDIPAAPVKLKPVSEDVANLRRLDETVSKVVEELATDVELDIDLLLDYSGSYSQIAPHCDECWKTFVEALAADPALDRNIRVRQTKMSGRVKSTGFSAPSKHTPVYATPGGGSPQHTLADSASELLDKKRQRLVVYLGDGLGEEPMGSPTMTRAMNRLRGVQRSHPVEVFPVRLGPYFDAEFFKQLSLRHEPLVIEDFLVDVETGKHRLDEFFRGLLKTVKAVTQGTVDLRTERSLTLDELDAMED